MKYLIVMMLLVSCSFKNKMPKFHYSDSVKWNTESSFYGICNGKIFKYSCNFRKCTYKIENVVCDDHYIGGISTVDEVYLSLDN